LPAGSAGITRHGDLGHELVRRGHQVTVLASRFNYLTRTVAPGRRAENVDGVTFRWLETGTYSGNDAGRVRSMIRFLVKATLMGVRLRARPDVVIGSSPQLLAGLSALVIARRYGVPFVFEVRDPWPSALVDLGAIKERGVAHRILERIEQMLYRNARRIVTVMAHADRRVAEVGEDATKCVVIPNASVIPPITGPVPAALEQTLEREAAAGRRIILYAGAHGLSNGLHEVLDALRQLSEGDVEAYESVSLVFVGDGPEKPALQRHPQVRTQGHVFFFDSVPKPAAMTAMTRADFVLVHFAAASFKRYGMSANKLFDAMALGCPVLLASPLDDTPVDTAGCGIRYEPGSPSNLADAISQALRLAKGERRLMSERGLAEARRMYSVDAMGAQFERLLLEVSGP
jgi:glycosyltransferase involved in cell wall biosynthesis